MFSHIPSEPSLNQTRIIKNFNLLVDAIKITNPDINFKKLPDGSCKGLSYCYKYYSHRGLREEYLLSLMFIELLKDTNEIKLVAEEYNQAIVNKKNYLVKVKGKELSLEKILLIMKEVYFAQCCPTIKENEMSWDKTYSFICHKNDLASHLKSLAFQTGESVLIDLGRHMFYVEKTENGFYLFEPNKIDSSAWIPCLINEDQLAIKISANSSLFISNNQNMAFSLMYISYPRQTKNDMEKAIDQLDEDELSRYPDLNYLIKQLRQKKISCLDFALMVDVIMRGITNLSRKFSEFKNSVNKYTIIEKNLVDFQFNYDKKKAKESIYTDNISHMYLAAKCNQILLVKQLINDEAEVNLVDDNGNSALYLAILHNYYMVAELLVNYRKTKVNDENKDRETPLDLAMNIKYREIVKLLLTRPDLDVNHKHQNLTPILLAICRPDFEIFVLLFNHSRIDVNLAIANDVTPLYAASQSGNLDMINLLLKKNVLLNAGITAKISVLLKEAERNNRKHEVEKLLQGITDSLLQFTPLHAAVFFDHANIVKALIEAGADIHAKSSNISCLQLAEAMGHDNISSLLRNKMEESTVNLCKF